MTKDVMDAIRERRSVRRFKSQPVNDATLGRILEAALYAPSAGNIQPWQFYVVHNQGVKEKLKEAGFNQPAISDAPVAVVVCVDLNLAGERYGERGQNLYCIQDSACAIQNMMLAATGFGIDTLWIGAFVEKQIQEVLDLPNHFRPIAIIPVGYGESDLEPPAKRPVAEVIQTIK